MKQDSAAAIKAGRTASPVPAASNRMATDGYNSFVGSKKNRKLISRAKEE
jgi:hypothetical protein